MSEIGDGLRRAVLADAQAIHALTAAAYADWVPLIGRKPKPMVADYAVSVQRNLIDLLYVNGELLALVEMIPQADHLLIENVAVLPRVQGRGYGRKLMGYAEQIAVSLGHTQTRLVTNELFVRNVQLYGRLGYRIDREEAFEGGLLVHMTKTI